jgi:hypothetical protein
VPLLHTNASGSSPIRRRSAILPVSRSTCRSRRWSPRLASAARRNVRRGRPGTRRTREGSPAGSPLRRSGRRARSSRRRRVDRSHKEKPLGLISASDAKTASTRRLFFLGRLGPGSVTDDHVPASCTHTPYDRGVELSTSPVASSGLAAASGEDVGLAAGQSEPRGRGHRGVYEPPRPAEVVGLWPRREAVSGPASDCCAGWGSCSVKSSDSLAAAGGVDQLIAALADTCGRTGSPDRAAPSRVALTVMM